MFKDIIKAYFISAKKKIKHWFKFQLIEYLTIAGVIYTAMVIAILSGDLYRAGYFGGSV